MATKLYLIATDITPEVSFDLEASTYIIKGRSMPEDSEKFYQQIIDWFNEQFNSKSEEAFLDVALDYYNTGSFIRLMALFNTLHALNEKGNKFGIRWICEEDDEDNIDDGQSFKEVVKLPFEIIQL